MRAILGTATAAVFLGWVPPALAWWDQGHMEIAALAYEQLDPEVRTTADRLIELNPKYAEWTSGLPEADKAKAAFVHAATWADDIKTDPTYAGSDAVIDPTAAQNIGYSDPP